MRLSLIVAILLWIASPPENVQAQDNLEPIAQASIDSPRVVVGTPIKMHVVVLAPNYMTSPPEMPSFQVRNAATMQGRSVNTTERRGDVTFAGVRFEYDIYPQEPGDYVIADQHITVKYAANPPVTREASVALPRVSFEAFLPAAAADLRPFLSATKLSAQQEIKRSSETLKVGDAITRTVRLSAGGTLAMLLPAQTFAPVDGLRVYPAQPELKDKIDPQTDVPTASRIDAATYMVERSGYYRLPAIDVGWWNSGSGKIEHISLDPVPIEVESGIAEDSRASSLPWTWSSLIDAVLDHWMLFLLGLSSFVALLWFAPGAMRRAANAIRHRWAIYLDSEAYSFRRLRGAVRRRNAEEAYFDLLGWLKRFEPIGRAGTIDDLVAAAGDSVLTQQMDFLRMELFAPERGTQALSLRKLLHHIGSARRKLRSQARHDERPSALPGAINPEGAERAKLSYRRVAR